MYTKPGNQKIRGNAKMLQKFYIILFCSNSNTIIKNVSSSTSHKKTPSLRLSVFMSFRPYVFTSVREFMKIIIAGTSCTSTLKWFSPLCNLELFFSRWSGFFTTETWSVYATLECITFRLQSRYKHFLE